jgi:hypothetical protein
LPAILTKAPQEKQNKCPFYAPIPATATGDYLPERPGALTKNENKNDNSTPKKFNWPFAFAARFFLILQTPTLEEYSHANV